MLEWHREGKNGCLFAQIAARKAEHVGWQRLSLGPDDSVSEPLARALADPECQLLSLSFPFVNTPELLLAWVRRLISAPGLILSHLEVVDERVALSLRTVVAPGPVLAWIMGFGPFDFFPATRQAPETELVIRTREKPEWLYEKHSHDRLAAHVADTPLGLDERAWPSLWDATHEHTRSLLGGPTDVFSAARTTLCLPTALWFSPVLP